MHRRSKKREAIYNAICNDKTHPTAEQIYNVVKEKEPDISLGTVYRNISEFEEEGLIKRIVQTDSQARYDGNMKVHDHFVCSRCGKICDTQRTVETDKDIQKITAEHSVAVDSVIYNGLCKKCLEQEGISDKEN